MNRLLFAKSGEAVWISHLDLMRLFQRAFKRAGLHLTHTQGFNPRPSVSIALPLSVGVESQCELLDFELDGDEVTFKEIAERLNEVLVEGVEVLGAYPNGMKIKNLALLDCEVTMEYDAGVPKDAEAKLGELFFRETLPVEKKGKNGPMQQDIIPMIRSLSVRQDDVCTLRICARVCCQNPSLNPAQIIAAIQTYLPELTPDFAKIKRIEIYDNDEKIFR